MVVRHSGGSEERLELRHTFSREQVDYFKAGSALNLLRLRGSGQGVRP